MARKQDFETELEALLEKYNDVPIEELAESLEYETERLYRAID